MEEPTAKRAKLDDMFMDFDLPDELLETASSSSAANQNSSAPGHSASTSLGIPNGSTAPNVPPAQFGSGFDNISSGQQRSFGENQPQHHQPAHFTSNGVMTGGGPAMANPNATSNSVLEELLLTNRTATSGTPASTGQPMFQPISNQRTPPSSISTSLGMMNAVQNRSMVSSAPVNRLGSPPNVQVMNRQMTPFSSSESYPAGGPGGLPLVSGNGNMSQYRPPLQQDHMMMMAGNGGRLPMMNGQKMNPGAAPNFMRLQRPPTSTGNMMMANGPMPGPNQQQMLPMNVMPQQQQMNPQIHMRMNGPTSMNTHMGGNHPFLQDFHPSQMQQPPFSMAAQSMGHQSVPIMTGGMRPRMHMDMNVVGPPRSMSDPFSPPMNMQPGDRMLAPSVRGPFQTQNPNMLSSLAQNPPMEILNSSMSNGLPMQQPIQPPSSSSSLPYPSPSALMSPSNSVGGPGSAQMANDLMGGGGGGHSSGAPQDPEKRKLIQQQLVLLLHALKCQQRERTSEQSACSLPHCGTMKKVLTHMAVCQEGRSCTVPHCASSRQILAHWRTCMRPDCPVCSPLRQMTDRSGRVNGSGGGPPTVNGHSTLEGPLSNESQIAKLPASDASQGRNLMDADIGSVRPSLRASHLLSQDSNDGSGSSFTPKLPAPEVASVQKEWHRQVTLDLRNHLVSKLVKAIFPSPDPAAMHDQRIRDLIQYARKVEKEMFETASDREEYYHLLAEKIYKIQKELQEKKQRRLEQAQGRSASSSAGQNGSPGGSSFLLSSFANEASSNSSSAGINGGISASQSINVKSEEGSTSCEASFPTATVKTEPPAEVEIRKTEQMESCTSSTDKSAKPVEKAEPAVKKVFTVDELSDALLPVWEKLEATDDAIPFRVPVDPKLLGIPDYFDVIKNPMDLSTIRSKLLNGEYKDPWQFCDDMWLMFENAWMYNRKASKVYKYCTKLSEMFVELIDPVMRSLGYCCGRKLSFTPLALVCYGASMCSIPRDAIYYCYEDNKSQYGVGSERYTYCKKCFEDHAGDSFNMSDDPASGDNVILKKSFKQLKNDQIEYEPFVDCVDCGRKWHKVCALHVEQIYPSGYICDTCVRTRGRRKPENRFTSKRLPQCKLSQHLEKRVNDFLKKKAPPETPEGCEVVIRVLSSSDKEVEVKPHMKNKYCSTGEMAEKFPYRAKAIFAFEVIDGVEVCFFGLHVQEYGSNSLPPNQRRVYIAYLDSVHFFTPKMMRTQVYHEILLGYLEYVKRLGYTMAHIWACPPSEGDDYIFHCHPPEQKIPKPKRLQEWYKKMLDKGIVERIVTDYKDIYDFYLKEEPLTTVTELPLFEGDYWPNIIEECIKDVENEEAARRKEAEAQAAAASASADDGEDELDEITASGKKRNAKGNKKNKSKSKSASSKKSKKGGGGTGDDLTDKLMAALEKHKEVFFVVRLYSKQSATALPPIVDPDVHITCDFMDGRDTFLSTARDRHWEFSSLRRAKYSTLALCYELHTQGSDKFVYTCNTCKNNNGAWHCAVCEDFDLCQDCYLKTQHEHKMDKILIAEGEASTSQDGQNSQNPRDRNESIQRCIQTLVHASQCRDANCRRGSCQKMKRVVQHVKTCKNWQSSGSGGSNACSVCRQLLTLCVFHARHCQENTCMVPLCQNIRQKLAERQAQLRKKREREMMRRINLMSNHNTMAAAGAGPGTPYQQTASPVPSMNVAPTPAMMGQAAFQQPAVNPAAVRAARDIEKIAQQQVQFGGVGMPYQQRAPMPPMRPPAPVVAMSQMVGGAGPGPGPGPGPSQIPQMQQQQQPWDGGGKPRSFAGHYPNSVASSSAPTNFVGGNPRPINEQIANVVQRLKNAGSPEEREAIMKALQAEPQIFAAIIRMTRQGQAPRQQQQPPQQQQMWNGPNQQPQPQQQPQGPSQPYFAPRQVLNNAQAPPGYGRLPAPMYGSRGALQQALSPQMTTQMGAQVPPGMQQQQHFMQHQQILEPGSNSADQNKFL